MGEKVEFFQLETFRTIVEKLEDGRTVSEATVKVHMGEDRFIETAEGNGPVNALTRPSGRRSSRSFPGSRYPPDQLQRPHPGREQGYGGDDRCLIDSSDGRGGWGSVGIGGNVVEASWEALVDSITYGLHRFQYEAAAG